MNATSITPPKIIAVCNFGLGNRVSTLLSALYIAEKTGHTVEIYWPRTNECDCDVSDIFDIQDCFTEIKQLPPATVRSLVINLFKDFEPQNNVTCVTQKNYKEYKCIEQKYNPYTDFIFIATPLFFFENNDRFIKNALAKLHINKKILLRVYSFLKKNNINKSVYGIHLRMTDRFNEFQNDEYLNLISQSQNNFFIASDDIATEKILNIYKNVITYPVKNSVIYNSNENYILRTKHSVIESFIVCLILSRTTIYPLRDLKYKGNVFPQYAQCLSSFLLLSYYYSFFKEEHLFKNII